MFRNTFYNDLNNIPIIEVAQKLGIAVNNYHKTMCFKGHDNKTPSLSFNIEENYFHCFGCNIGGGSIRLVMLYMKYNFNTACKWLEGNFSNKYSFTKNNINQLKCYRDVKQKDNYKSSKQNYYPDVEVYEWLLRNASLSNKGYNYFTKVRGFSPKIIEYYNLKDLPNPKTILSEALSEWGQERLIKCGLWKYKDDILTPIWFNHILLFPFKGLDGRIAYIQGRLLLPFKNYRYINVNGVKSTIFNIDIIKKIRANDKIIICEGIPDAINVSQRGYNAVGIVGASSFKKDYIKYFIDFNVGVLPDNDQGGKTFYDSINQAFKIIGKSVTRIKVDKDFKDISEYLENKNEIS